MAPINFTLLLFLLHILPFAAVASETDALLHFKQKLHDPLGVLDQWNASTQAAPCDWRGVLCEDSKVRELRLPRLQLSGEISEEIGGLRFLRRLSLHSNNFNGSIPEAISECTQLVAVYLQYNALGGEIPPLFFSNLISLQVLNLAHNYISGEIPGTISGNLRVLDVSSNSFSGALPGNFSATQQLRLMNFSFNRFSGQIPATIGELQHLQYLWLDGNSFVGTIPSALSNSSSLIHVSAGNNMLTGVVPATLGSLRNLQAISVPGNQLNGVVSASLLCTPSAVNATIRILNLSLNAFTGLEYFDGRNCVSALEVLDLHGNQINGVFPVTLVNFLTLRVVDVSGNLISGTLPENIGSLVNLEELRIGINSLSGEIPRSLTRCGSLRVFDISKNQFSGLLPEFLGELRSLKRLILGQNFFTGSVPASMGSLSSLEVLDVGNNNLTGVIPPELLKLSNLTSLDLSNNNFSDQILQNIGEMKVLQSLNMSGCGFSGVIPSGIGDLLNLRTLDLSTQNLSGSCLLSFFGLPNLQVLALDSNSFSGAVPEGFSSLSGLQYLNLSSNGFTGQIPVTYGFLRSLSVLSLSDNQLSGSVPSDISHCSALRVLELKANEFSGSIPADFSKLSSLEKLDLGQNSLTGVIPDSISNCSSLVTLSLDSNQLSGKIPATLSNLSSLKQLDLSSNNLSGVIPANLAMLPALEIFNVSNNNLVGAIPELLASRFDNPSDYALNKNLCGKPLKKNCGSPDKRRRIRLILFIAVAFAGSIMLLLCCCGYIYGLIMWRRKLIAAATGEKKTPSRGSQGSRSSGDNGAPKLIMFNSKITYSETVEATRQFDEENVLSRGKYGLLFKATFSDGMVLAIRRLPDMSIPEHTFRKEAESLGRVKHRNLTVLRGYYAGPPPDMRLMVYDYMPNGNLATLLQEASNQEGHILNWPMRHLIALGIARGLAFLHSVPIVHGDVKPQNVLFDADFEPHLSEIGLDKVSFPAITETSTSTLPIGTVGYVAPEVTLTGQLTKEGDVYSFGIVVLEILTGKKPVMFSQDEDIVNWVKRQLQRGQVSELLEPGLLELDPESSEWEEFLLGVKVGLLCTMADPMERPSMTDVVFMLEGCRLGPEVASSTDPTTVPLPCP